MASCPLDLHDLYVQSNAIQNRFHFPLNFTERIDRNEKKENKAYDKFHRLDILFDIETIDKE